jgi:hypothetical protein
MDKISEENEKFTLINFYYYGSKDLNEPRLIKEFNDLEFLKEPEKIESKPKILSKQHLSGLVVTLFNNATKNYQANNSSSQSQAGTPESTRPSPSPSHVFNTLNGINLLPEVVRVFN